MIRSKQIMTGFILCFTRLNGMEQMREVHPFMLSTVSQSLQIIKDKQLSCLSTDHNDDVITLEELVGENESVIQNARKVFEQQMDQGPWMYGEWLDGKKWKVNTRCGLGLFTVLTEKSRNREGKQLILRAAIDDNSSWGQYYVGLFILIKKAKIGYIESALKCLQGAHTANPNQIPAHWYRHIMAVAGWEAEPKDNWVTWFDEQLCKNHKGILSYPLAVFARESNDTVGAEMLCLKEAVQHQNRYRGDAIKTLYRYCLPQRDGTLRPDAQEAEDTLRDIASKSKDSLIESALKKLDARKQDGIKQ